MIGVTQEAISGYERGDSMPKAEIILKLCSHFNCSADYLLDLTDIKTPVKELIFDNLKQNESELILKYRALDEGSKNKILGFIEALSLI